MADIELVIKLSEKDLEIVGNEIFTVEEMFESTQGRIYRAIVNGKPLPKGHGRIGDLDIILNKAIKHCNLYSKAEDGYCRGRLHAYEMYAEEVKNADTIIEADKAESEG